MATLRTRGLCALGNVSNSPPPKRTKRTKAISACEDFEDSKDSDDGACAPKKKRKTKVFAFAPFCLQHGEALVRRQRWRRQGVDDARECNINIRSPSNLSGWA